MPKSGQVVYFHAQGTGQTAGRLSWTRVVGVTERGTSTRHVRTQSRAVHRAAMRRRVCKSTSTGAEAETQSESAERQIHHRG